jgi:UDP-GlcNAc:undecaprenyl-phosphate GlcNAc-1-phosphate transferase
MFNFPFNISDLLKPGVIFSEEYLKYIVHLPNFVYGFLIALLLTPIIGKLAFKYGITYKPASKRLGKDYDNAEKAIHDVETPALGGLAVTLPLLIFVIVMFGWNSISAPFIIALTIMIVGSTLDDIYNLPAIAQLGTQLLASAVIAFSIIDISIIASPFGGIVNLNWANLSFSAFNIPWNLIFPGEFILVAWIMICINAVKWVGGSPGLMESNSFVAFILLYILGIRTASDFVTVNSIFIAGGLLGFLVFAFPPQKIFSGTPGKALYGFIIAVFAIINGAKFASTLMILLLPILDFAFVIIKRIIKHKEFNPVKLMRLNGKDHLHHQLISLGLSRKQVLMAESSITLFIGSIAILSTGASKLFLLVIAAFLILTGILAINIFKQKAEEKRVKELEPESPESKYTY